MNKELKLTTSRKFHKFVYNQQETISLRVLLHSKTSHLLVNLGLSGLEFEERITKFIQEEIIHSELTSNFISTNKNLLEKLHEFGFISNGSLYQTDSCPDMEFSTIKKEGWVEIKEILKKIYDSESGLLREIQDRFFLEFNSDKLAGLFNKKSFSTEEELFIRVILVKGYLTSFHQLIVPYQEDIDKLTSKIKLKFYSLLEEAKNNGEIPHLEKNGLGSFLKTDFLSSSEVQFNSYFERKDRESLQKKVVSIKEQFRDFNFEVNTGKSVISEKEVAHYFTSFDHWSCVVSGEFGSFGLNSKSLESFFAKTKCTSFVLNINEAWKQINNELTLGTFKYSLKTMKRFFVIEHVKPGLQTLERIAIEHYFDSILSPWLKNITDNHNRNAERFYNSVYKEHLINERWFKNGIFKTIIEEKNQELEFINHEICLKRKQIGTLNTKMLDLGSHINSKSLYLHEINKPERNPIEIEKRKPSYKSLEEKLALVQGEKAILEKELLEFQNDHKSSRNKWNLIIIIYAFGLWIFTILIFIWIKRSKSKQLWKTQMRTKFKRD